MIWNALPHFPVCRFNYLIDSQPWIVSALFTVINKQKRKVSVLCLTSFLLRSSSSHLMPFFSLHHYVSKYKKKIIQKLTVQMTKNYNGTHFKRIKIELWVVVVEAKKTPVLLTLSRLAATSSDRLMMVMRIKLHDDDDDNNNETRMWWLFRPVGRENNT